MDGERGDEVVDVDGWSNEVEEGKEVWVMGEYLLIDRVGKLRRDGGWEDMEGWTRWRRLRTMVVKEKENGDEGRKAAKRGGRRERQTKERKEYWQRQIANRH